MAKPGNRFLSGHSGGRVKQELVLKYCRCGCGGKCKNKIIKGHNSGKRKKTKNVFPIILAQKCFCACGNYAKSGCRYIKGHQRRGKSSGNKGHSSPWRGKTYEEHFGEEKASQIKQKWKLSILENGGLVAWNKGLKKETEPRLNHTYPKERKKPKLTEEQREAKRKLFTGANNPNFNPNKTDFQKYKIECKFVFNLGDFPDEFELEKIRGLFHPFKNKIGYTRDHMLSIYDGFILNIPNKDICHPANCILLSHAENSKKNKISSITQDELYIRIEKWEKKYGKK